MKNSRKWFIATLAIAIFVLGVLSTAGPAFADEGKVPQPRNATDTNWFLEQSKIPIPEFPTLAILAFTALAASLQIARKLRKKSNIDNSFDQVMGYFFKLFFKKEGYSASKFFFSSRNLPSTVGPSQYARVYSGFRWRHLSLIGQMAGGAL